MCADLHSHFSFSINTMKKTKYFIYPVCICFFGLVACKNGAKSELKTPEITQIDSTNLRFASTWQGKYASDIRILDEKTDLNKRIRTLLKTPERYGQFAERCAVQSPMIWQKKVLFMTACAPHACTYDEIGLFLDTDADKLWLIILTDGLPTLIAEDANAAKPSLLTDYLAQLTK